MLHAIRRRLTAAIALSVMVAGLWSTGCGRHSILPELELTELSRVSVPREFQVAGARIQDSSVVMWGTASSSILVGRLGEPLVHFGDNVLLRPLAAALVAGGRVEVIDVARKELLRFAPTGTLEARFGLDSTLTITSAYRGHSAWRVVGLKTTGSSELATLSCTTPRCAFTDRMPIGASRSDPVYLVDRGHEPIISYVTPPFGTIAPSSGTHSAFIPIEVAKAKNEYWVGMPSLPVGTGYVCTFADLRSNKRLIVLLDSARDVVRVRAIDEPIAFVDSDPASRRLAAVAAGEQYVLVVYSYRWSSEPTTQP